MSRSRQKSLTPRQQVVLAIFRQSSIPLTPQEAWEAAIRDSPGIGLATVYRAVRILTEAGELRPVEIADEIPRYEMASGPHHHHFYCRKCTRIYEVHKCPPRLDDLVPQGFKMDDHSIVLYGTCRSCLGDRATTD